MIHLPGGQGLPGFFLIGQGRRERRLRIIGLTGGIACGKSHVSQVLRTLGAAIIDGDVLSRQLTAPGGPAIPAIREQFGAEVFLADGQLNRRALAERIFQQETERKKLDAIMQPLILRQIHQALTAAREAQVPVCVLDMPLLYEQGLETLCDRVWCVSLPEEEQLRRLMQRDQLTKTQAQARLRSQMPAGEKADRADVVIDTSGTLEETAALIPALYRAEITRREEESDGTATP